MRSTIAAILAGTLVACSARDESPPAAGTVVAWKATPGATRLAPDGRRVLDVVLTGEVAEGWKLYSLTQKGDGPAPMRVNVSPEAQLEGEVKGPAATRSTDPNFNIETETYTGTPVFRFAVKLPSAIGPAKPVEVQVTTQACNDNVCLPSRTTTLTVTPNAGPA